MHAARRLLQSVFPRAVMFARTQNASVAPIGTSFRHSLHHQLTIDTLAPPSGKSVSALASLSLRTRVPVLSSQQFPGGANQAVQNLSTKETTLPSGFNQAQNESTMQEEGTRQRGSSVSEPEGDVQMDLSPGEGKCPEGPPAIGIDLGTAFSRVAVWNKDSLEVIPLDAEGNKEMPTCVAFGESVTGEKVLIGRAALELLPRGGAIHRVRRILGRVDTDESLVAGAQSWPFIVQSLGIGVRPVVALKKGNGWVSVSPEEVTSLILHHLKQSAERFLGQGVRNAVLTTPAAFDRFQCRLLADSAARAGLCVQRIVAEPNAVGLLYAYEKKAKEGGSTAEEAKRGEQDMDTETNVLIFHLGSGYCSVGIVSIDDGVSQSRAIAGEPFGMDDFVSNLVARALADYKKTHPDVDVHAALDRQGRFKLWQAFREATEKLLLTQTVRLEGAGEQFNTDLTRAHFEDVNKPLFARCLDMVTRCLADARLETAQIADVLVLGGGAKIPKLEEMLAQLFTGGGAGRLAGGDGFKNDFLVRGAALEAAIASGMEGVDKGLLLLQGINHNLSVRVQGDVLVPVLNRNALIPTSRELVFTTCNDDQQQAIIQIFEGEQPVAEQNVFLGCVQVGPLPPTPAGVLQIMVCMDVDAGDGLSVCTRVEPPEEGVKGPEPIVVKLPSVDLGHGWCTEALRVKYGASADVRLHELSPGRKRNAEQHGRSEKKQEMGA